MKKLQQIIDSLKEKEEVDAVFLTGSLGDNTSTQNSDVDLIVILRNNSQDIESVFTWIDGVFADIYFFDLENIKRISELDWLPESFSEIKHKTNTLLYVWLQKGKIQFDKSGELTKLKHAQKPIEIFEEIAWNSWIKINYNFETNTRYFNADDSRYHEALEIRLLYSVVEVISTYFSFINKRWDGEKNAITYLKKNDPGFYKDFVRYTRSTSLEERFKNYSLMVQRVFELNPDYPLWQGKEVIPKSKKGGFQIDNELVDLWERLTN